MSSKKVFITGGSGYIGSHTCVELLQAGYDIVVYDNLSNSSIESLKRVETITGKSIQFIQGDLRDKIALKSAMTGCHAVIHFAGLKAVGESVEQPLLYYEHNVFGSLCLFQVMQELNIKSIVFSSSATVYGAPQQLPLTELHPTNPTNPYGDTKLTIETMLQSLFLVDNQWHIALLRYFNPVGAHPSGQIGENPTGTPNNLMPFITQVAIGKRNELTVFGNDYDTPDGTGIRDYIHVVDLAKGHVNALNHIHELGCETINLGTGKGYSVLDVIKAFEEASKQPIAFTIANRRPGDVAACYADPEKAHRLLKWKAELDLPQMCEDSWNWQQRNPNGY